MKNITYILILVSTILLGWLLPWAYQLANPQKESYPFPYYSCITNSFCYTVPGEKNTLRLDAKGNKYSEAEFDSILPFFYFRQLVKDDRLPDSILGVKVTPKFINTTNFFYRYRPKDKHTPKIKLYPLFESMGKKVDIEMPGDVFRFNDKIEFVDAETNTVLDEKSKLYMEQYEKKGFVPPVKFIAGTPSTRKPYDEGYFIVDAKSQVFHLKKVNGKPFLKNIGIDVSISPSFIATTEYPSKNIYGFLFGEDNRIYAISTDKYKLINIPVPAFSQNLDDLLIMGNMFHWNVRVINNAGLTAYALDAELFNKIDSISFPKPKISKSFVNKWLMPFSLTFKSANSEYVKPHFSFNGWYYLVLSFIMAGLFILLYRKKITAFSWPVPVIWIVLTGIYGLISTLVINPLNIKK